MLKVQHTYIHMHTADIHTTTHDGTCKHLRHAYATYTYLHPIQAVVNLCNQGGVGADMHNNTYTSTLILTVYIYIYPPRLSVQSLGVSNMKNNTYTRCIYTYMCVLIHAYIQNTHIPSPMQEVVNLCKRRGFMQQSAELYGGIKGCYDYGPHGVELKRNIAKAWCVCVCELTFWQT